MEIDKAAKIKQVFSDLNRKFEEQETQRNAGRWHLPYFDLTGFPIEQTALSAVSKEEARAAESVPFFKEGPMLRLGVVRPGGPELKRLLAGLNEKKIKPEIYLVSQSGWQTALAQYKKIVEPSSVGKHQITAASSPEVLKKLQGLGGLGEELLTMPVTDLLALVIGGSIFMRSSDIHLEPEKDSVKLRFRVDGVLQDVAILPKAPWHNLLSRIKLLSGLKLNVTSIPQDGRFSVKGKGGNLDLRVSVLPTAFGESVVMRILTHEETAMDIEQLGLRGRAMAVIREELGKPNGMILTTGPTGSGKTTTLYAFLNHLNRPGVKVITLEDPVEYVLAGISQTPIDHAAGMDFAKGLRSILRQDPDIVMVGEIRDLETAQTASQAALTGHMVLSTLHTNDAAGAIPRLLDLGVKPVTLAPALSALIAQRLLRRLCPDCRGVYHPPAKEMDRVKLILFQIPKNSGIEIPAHFGFYHSQGCAACHNLGYRGRIGVFEVFPVDEKIQELIFNQASSFEIKKQAVSRGMMTMQQDGILKAMEGLTDLAEVWRVTEE